MQIIDVDVKYIFRFIVYIVCYVVDVVIVVRSL